MHRDGRDGSDRPPGATYATWYATPAGRPPPPVGLAPGRASSFWVTEIV
jgi:hypothetical protein